MSEQAYSSVVRTAREYYNSADADNFYAAIWGGEDIHIGLYRDDAESIAEASRRTVRAMADKLDEPGPDTRVLDLGSGYGGSMRYLASTFGCRCEAINLSEVENERARALNREHGVDGLVNVIDGDFSRLPFDDAGFDVVWSQDAILHSDDRAGVCTEAARVLKSGGRLVFTDPMQSDEASPRDLQPVYDRIHLDSLASPGFYRRTLGGLGLNERAFEDHSDQLPRHYARVREELTAQADRLRSRGVSHDYIQRMRDGLGHWVDGGRRGDLCWGIFVFDKV